jgi:hypothetical protein
MNGLKVVSEFENVNSLIGLWIDWSNEYANKNYSDKSLEKCMNDLKEFILNDLNVSVTYCWGDVLLKPKLPQNLE